MALPELSDRERRVLASRTLSRRFGLGVSPATIRNTMSDLEDKGLLYHPHTSAGRIPTERAYRLYVDSLLGLQPRSFPEQDRLKAQISEGDSAIEAILRRAAQTLGILTQELGVALGPQLDQARVQRLELVRLSAERLLLVLTLDGGAVRTIFVEVRSHVADEAVSEVTRVLNERLAGLTTREICGSIGDRLRDTSASPNASELLNIFVQEGDQLIARSVEPSAESVVLSQASLLAEQPEFASGQNLRRLMQLTETREHLADVLRTRGESPGLTITIGNEHGDARLSELTVVTAQYRAGALSGVIGVIGPTRMPYDKVIALVTHTSQLVSDLLD
jgi:heat-inducible transcriptional repressor